MQSLTTDSSFLLGRHLYENIDGTARWLGNRFHSLAGEPRDAIPALCFFFVILRLIENLANSVKVKLEIRSFVFILFLITFLFTKSMTGVFAISLYLFYFLLKNIIKLVESKNKQKLSNFSNLFNFFSLIIFNLREYIGLSRIFDYSDSLFLMVKEPDLIYTTVELTGKSLFGQLPDLNILVAIINNINNGNFLSLIFGNGLGNSGYYNANTLNFTGLSLPFSDLIRWLFDIGIFGLVFYFCIKKIYL